MSLASRLKERRLQLGLKQSDIANALGITAGAIANYETGVSSPKASILYRVFDVLHCDANYLFQDEIREQREHAATFEEMENLVKKYRVLDGYGKEAVDSVLEVEHKRCTERVTEEPTPDNITYLHLTDQRTSAGTGFLLSDEHSKMIAVRLNELTRKADFCVTVVGRSMEPVIHDGDTVLIRSQPAVDVGQIGLFVVNDKGYIKQQGEDGLISLNPEFSDVHPSEFDNARCSGLVLGVLNPDWIIEK